MRRRTLVGLATALGIWTVPVHGQSTFNFDLLCTVGEFQACASVHLTAGRMIHPTRHVEVHTLTVRLWNLNGVIGEATAFSTIAVFHDPSIGMSWSADWMVATYVTTEGETGSPINYWERKEPGSVRGIAAEVASDTKGHRQGVVGCEDPWAHAGGLRRAAGRGPEARAALQ